MVAILILTVLFTDKAFSFYLDPGTGSYLTQIIIASALSLMFYLKNITNLVKGTIQKFKSKH